jgi:hypothetical protein
MLVERAPRRRIFLLSGLSAACTALTAGWTLSHTSVYDGALPPSLLLGTLGFDVTSFIVAFALAAVVVALDRGAERFWLLWLGLQAYLLYSYSLFAFGLVFTPLYLAYLAIMGLSAYSLAGFAVHFDSHVLARWNAGRMPRRTMGVSLMMVAVVFAVLWILTIFGFLGDDMPQSAAIVLVLDLAFTLPLLVIVAVLLLRREPLGDFLAPGVFVMSAAITLAVAAGEFLRPAFGEPFSFAVSAPYLVPGLVCAAFSLLSFRRVSSGLAGS